MAGQGFLGNLYYSITGEDKLEEILRKDKKLAEEVAKIAGGIKIGNTRVTQDGAKEILAELKTAEKIAKTKANIAVYDAKIANYTSQSIAMDEKAITSMIRRETAEINLQNAQDRRAAIQKKLSQTDDTAAGSIKMLEAELKKLRDTYRSLSEADRNSPLGQTMLKEINNADENLAKINAQMANNANLAKTMGTQYNGLRTQIGMVARELPNLGISLGTFIISLSNNLPYLADEIAKARKEYDNMIKTNQKATPVWKQMIGAVLNWQTALIVGVTVLVAYSREIQAWVQEMIKGNSAASILADTQKFLNELHEEAAKSASKELSQLKLLYGVTQDATRTVEERTAATEQLQKLFPDYLGKLSSEAILAGNAQAAYDALTISIKNSEEARKINLENAALDEAEIKAIKERREAEDQLAEAGKELERQRKLPWIINYKGIQDAELAYGHFLEKIDRANSKIEGINESRKKLQESYKPKVTTEFEVPFEDMTEYKTYQKTMSDLDRLLSMSVVDQEEYNKRLNDAKGILIDAADAAEIGGEKLEEFRKEYIAFNKAELAKKAQKTTDKEAKEIYKAQQEYLKATKALEDAVRKSERDIEQTRINLMEEGGEKQLAQLKLNFKKRMDEVKVQTDAYVKMVQDQELKAWKEKNPTKKESEYSYKTVDYKTLPKEFQDIIDEMIETENQLYEKSIQDYFDSVAKGFRGYLEKREAIEKEFAEKRKTLVHSGAPQSSLSELDYQEDETLQKIDLEFAQREQTFQRWANQITSMSLEQLRILLIEAQFELSKMEKLHPENGESLAQNRAKVATLRDQIDKIEITPNKKGKDANKEWQELYKTLNEINGSFQEIGNTVGGTAGEIIKTAGKISSSTLQIVKGIQTLAQNSATAIQGTAVAASTAISTVEKASVILAIISAALQVAMAIVNLFKKDDYMEKFRMETEKLNHELSLLKLNAQIDKNKDSIFGNDLWNNAKNNINVAREALERYNTVLDNIANRKKHTGLKGLIAEAKGIKNSYDSASQSIADMQLQVRHSTWLRSAKYQSLKDAVPELFKDDGSVDMDALDKFIGSDTFKKLSAENQKYLQEMSDYWKTYKEAVDSVRDYLSGVFGDFGNTLSDALVDAFKNGTDAAKSFTSSVSDMLETLATQMAYSIFIGPELEKAQKEISDIMLDTALSEAEKFEKAGEVVDRATDNIMQNQGKYNAWLQDRKDEAKDKGYDIFQPDAEKQNALSKGIQGVTEDTAGVIGSYLNAMRADLSVNRVNLQSLVDNAIPFFNDFALRVADLKHLETIANNTGRNADVAQRILDRLVAMTTAGSATRVNIK